MTAWNFIKIEDHYAADITDEFELSAEAQTLIDDYISPADFLKQLIEQQLYIDAILFLAYALPKREGTWWACICARSGLQKNASAHDIKAIELAEAWVYQPTKENCQPTMQAAERTNFQTPAGWAAIAAFWSGESIATVAGINMPPDEDLSCKAVNAAAALAASIQKPEEIAQYHQLFLKQGIDIACGGNGHLESHDHAST